MFESLAAVVDADPGDLVHLVFSLTDEQVAGLPRGEAEALVAATQRVVNAVSARQVSALETVARRWEERCEQEAADIEASGGRPFHTSGHQMAAGSVAPLLRVAPRTMSARIDRARRAVCELPQVQRLAWSGDLEPYRLDAVVREAVAVEPARLPEFESRLLEADLSPMSTSALRRRARTCAQKVCPGSAEQVAAEAAARRDVRVSPGAVAGMTRLVADLPTATAARLWSSIDGLAAEYVRANPGCRVPAARADALADLIEANSTIRTTIELVAPIDCESGDAPRPRAGTGCTTSHEPSDPTELDAWDELGCEELDDGLLHHHGDLSWFVSGLTQVPTVGSLLPSQIVALLNDPEVTVRLARSDLQTGAIRWQDPTAYQPSGRTVRAVRSRDGTCRLPGCATPARRCQLDHVVRFPDVLTIPANLQSLCTTHHGFKHHAGWTVKMDGVGVCTWSAPDGRRHTTWPFDRHGVRAA